MPPPTNPQKEKFMQIYKLNIKNIIVNKHQVENIINSVFEKINKRRFKSKVYKRASINNVDIYIKAFTHESFLGEQRFINTNPPDNIGEIKRNPHHAALYNFVPNHSNERLEFLGDSRIDDVVVEYLYERFPEQREDFLTKLKIRLVKTEMLSFLAQKLGLQDFLLLSSYQDSLEKKVQGRNNPKMLENCFEAFIGAIVEDFKLAGKRGEGYDLTFDFITCLLELYVDLQELIMNNDNFKDSILRYFQSIKQSHPKFQQVFFEGKPNDRSFTTVLVVPKSYIYTLNEQTKRKIYSYHQFILNSFQSLLANKIAIYNQMPPITDPEEHTIDCWKKGCEICQTKYIIECLKKFDLSDQVIIGTGKESTKKKTEQLCSKYALINLSVDLNF